MTERRRHREIPEEHRAAQHLDNERTFLAWVRTNVALISLGFVLARLSPSLSAAGAGLVSEGCYYPYLIVRHPSPLRDCWWKPDLHISRARRVGNAQPVNA